MAATTPYHTASLARVLALFLWFLAPAHSQVQFGGPMMRCLTTDIASALADLANPHSSRCSPRPASCNESQDTAFGYDLVVRFDPTRYRDPHVGSYPLSIMDQFILRGKRVSLSPATPTGPAAAAFYTTSPSAITPGFSPGTDGACTCPRRVPRSHLLLRSTTARE